MTYGDIEIGFLNKCNAWQPGCNNFKFQTGN